MARGLLEASANVTVHGVHMVRRQNETCAVADDVTAG